MTILSLPVVGPDRSAAETRETAVHRSWNPNVTFAKAPRPWMSTIGTETPLFSSPDPPPVASRHLRADGLRAHGCPD